MDHQLIKELSTIFKEEQLIFDEPLKNHTTFRVGGPAEIFVTIEEEEELQKVLSLFGRYGVAYFLLGKGSNLCVSDKGFEGAILRLGEGMSRISCEGNRIIAGAGASLSRVAALACKNNLKGFEFAAGIPGTVGGAMVMNAGAYGGEMKQVVESVRILDESGMAGILTCDEMEFGYRTSILKKAPYIVTEVTFLLQPGNREEIEETMRDLAMRRKEKQPLEYPSAGSTFKRPEGHFAGKLIGDSGLSGASVGDAQVSEKHNGFVINKGNACAKDIKELIALVQKKVQEDSGVLLEPEVIFLGEE